MELHTYTEKDTFIVALDGDLDASSSLLVDDAIQVAIRSQFKQILIDCSYLKYISSAGLGVFMSHLSELRAREIEMALFGMSMKVKNIFSLVGLDQLMTIVPSKNEAFAHYREAD
jgi:anti-sigma B factor antagonist